MTTWCEPCWGKDGAHGKDCPVFLKKENSQLRNLLGVLFRTYRSESRLSPEWFSQIQEALGQKFSYCEHGTTEGRSCRKCKVLAQKIGEL